MAAIEALQKEWRDAAQFRRFRPYLHIDDDGLTLGAGTGLAPMGEPSEGAPALMLDGEEARLLATLSLGFGRAISAAAIKFIRRASMQWTRGEHALAHFELAYARLPRFATREAAKQLFYADGFLRIGISPRALMLARGLDTSQLDLLKFIPHYNPAEPRVPRGNPDGGDWTREGPSAPVDQSASDAHGDIHLVAEIRKSRRRKTKKNVRKRNGAHSERRRRKRTLKKAAASVCHFRWSKKI